MATTFTAFNNLSNLLGNSLLDLDSGTFKLALVLDTYTFDATDTQWSEISTKEASSGSGYTTGGETLTSLSYAQVSGLQFKWDAADVTWTALTKTFRFGVLYKSGTFGAYTDPVIGCILFDDTPANVQVTGVDFSVVWHANGITLIGQ